MANTIDIIITCIPGLKGDDIKKLVSSFSSEEELKRLAKAELEQFLGHTIKVSLTWDKIFAQAEKDEKNAMLRGIKIISYREDEYPPLLREIFDPPALLFYRGNFPKAEKSLVAVVGTRKPSSAASAQAFILGKELALLGVPVVSGLALGIDALAHRGNIEGGASTVAVLGSGLDMIYPVSNRPLARRILETGGCILSEYAPGTVPRKWHFPARNRIISGISRGTVIVEAPEKSGARITARFAIEQNRDLMVASTGAGSRIGKGTALLADEGARIISSGRDIVEEINIVV